jgi:Ca2+-binding RTX toxin-like protein
MAVTYQSTDSIGTGWRFDYAAAGDEYVVLRGVTIASTNNFSIQGTEGSLSLRIDGAAIGIAYLNLNFAGGGDDISIGTSGQVLSLRSGAANANVLLAGGGSRLSNAGEISSTNTQGLLVQDGNNEILNDGLITGSSAIRLGAFGGAGDRLVNNGTINATAYDDLNQNQRFNNAVQAEGDNTLVYNGVKGVLSAVSSEGAGVSIGSSGLANSGDGSSVKNFGEITSLQWYGVDFFNMEATEVASLKNFGTISGGSGAFRGNESGETIVNAGLMVGDVLLGGGNDIFKGRNGSVDGEIKGGSGADILTGSKSDDDILKGESGADILKGRGGDDTLLGGGGNDTITGGKGDDSLTGNGGNDIFVFGKFQGNDVITDFQNNKDKFDLSAFGFASKAAALAKFYELGSASNNKLAFDYKDTTIIIKGIDMGDLNNADLIV